MSELREKMMHDLRLARLAEDTRQRYLSSISCFAQRHGRSPGEMGQDEVRVWIRELEASGISPSRLNQHFAALKFLYRRTLARPEVVSFLSTPRRPKRLPVVLSVEEVHRILAALKLAKFRVLFTTVYATGLRIGEVCSLETHDIDAGTQADQALNHRPPSSLRSDLSVIGCPGISGRVTPEWPFGSVGIRIRPGST